MQPECRSTPSRSSPSTVAARHSGFTLIELLLVVTIIGILASLLLPVLSRGISAAKSTQCKSNLRQLGLATASYAAEHGEYPAMGTYTSMYMWLGRPYDNISRDIDWLSARSRMWPACPDRLRVQTGGRQQMGFWYAYNTLGSEALKSPGGGLPPNLEWGLGLARSGAEPWGLPIKEGEVVMPSDMIAFSDGVSRVSQLGIWSPYTGREFDWPHLNTVNTAFCDGHVETIKRRVFQNVQSGSDDLWRRWNRDHEPHPEAWRKLP